MDRMLEMDPDFLVSCHCSRSNQLLTVLLLVDHAAAAVGHAKLRHGQDAEVDPDFLVSCYSSSSNLLLTVLLLVDNTAVGVGHSELQHGQDAGDGPRLPGELSR
jgi:hypothetical protein